ncbi:hypothetical protein [Streptomyces clavuligerus]|uniref:hypothetical protein n=1 Tax=Streptomyces clavuligerus TaxID=1901 RepID=UPI0030B8C8B5
MTRLLRRLTDRIVMRGLRREADRARALVGLDRLRTAALENIARPPDLYLMGTVPSFEFPRADLLPGTHFVGGLLGPPPDDPFDPPGWWEELRGGDRPVVLITQGTTANDVGRLLVPAVRALADPGRPRRGHHRKHPRRRPAAAVAGKRPAGTVRPLPPSAAARGGDGDQTGATTASTRPWRRGCPWSSRRARRRTPTSPRGSPWTGAGAVLGRRAVSEARLRAAVTAVLHDGRYRRRARALAREHRGRDAPRRAAELIESLAGAPGQIPIGGVTR